jgi:hypothetical protein
MDQEYLYHSIESRQFNPDGWLFEFRSRNGQRRSGGKPGGFDLVMKIGKQGIFNQAVPRSGSRFIVG